MVLPMFRPLPFAGLLLLSTPAVAADVICDVPAFRHADNQTTNARMIVKAGRSCRIGMGKSLTGPTEGEVIAPPRHGVTTVADLRVNYVPDKGFTGADSFTFARRSVDGEGNPVVRTVNVSVDVLP
jgi:hypothetical protein